MRRNNALITEGSCFIRYVKAAQMIINHHSTAELCGLYMHVLCRIVHTFVKLFTILNQLIMEIIQAFAAASQCFS